MKSTQAIVIAVVVVLGVAALVIGGIKMQGNGAEAARPAAETSGDDHDHSAVHTAPDFTLKTLGGEEVTFSEARKGKVAILKFGALWCGWCQKQAEEFAKLQPKLDPEKTIIFEVSVSNDEPVEKVREHAKKKGLVHTIVRDENDKAASKYGVEFLPTLFVISPDGHVVWKGAYTEAEKLAKIVEQAHAHQH